MTDGGDCNIPIAFLKKRGDIKYLLCILNHISVILSVILFGNFYGLIWRECSGSVIECFTRDIGAAGSSLTGVTALCP